HTPGTAIWSPNLTAFPGMVWVLQPDGNFVAYDKDGIVRWSSNTANSDEPVPGPAPAYPRSGSSAVFNPDNSHMEVYFRSGGNLAEQWWGSAGWTAYGVANNITAGRPVAVYNPVGNSIEVYYNSGGHLAEWYYTADTGWHSAGF